MNPKRFPLSPLARPCLAPALGLLLVAGLAAAPVRAEEDVGDVFKSLGTAHTVDAEGEDEAALSGLEKDEGVVRGRVFDGEMGVPVRGVTVILIWPTPADGSEAHQEVRVTDADGAFSFSPVPAGKYTVSFVKSGYRASTMTDFAVQPAQINVADFPLPPLPPEGSDQVLQLEAFVVEAETVGQMMESIELREESDLQLNIMSAEDLSKFASSNVADALKRVAGVNVEGGEFAIIRGLEDRYSSTLFNSAVIPSPDPNRQSVQLDLIPSEVVSNLVVAKTFAPWLPSNSSGGSIDIVTSGYPSEAFTFKVKGDLGFNENALSRFLEYDPDQPTGTDNGGGTSVLGPEAGLFLGGTTELFGHSLRYKAIVDWQLAYATAEGWQETREPRRGEFAREGRPNQYVTAAGDLLFGEVSLSKGRFALTTSERAEQFTVFGGLGGDLDEAGNHQVDLSVFYTRKKQDIVESKQDGFLPGFDYDSVSLDGEAPFFPPACLQGCAVDGSFVASVRGAPDEEAARSGPVWFSSFMESRSFGRERDLLVTQLNGSDNFDALIEGLSLTWAANYATTSQKDQDQSLRFVYEPSCANILPFDAANCAPVTIPVTVASVGDGLYAANTGRGTSFSNDVKEHQWFGRGDLTYARDLGETVSTELRLGGWYETAKRDVESQEDGLPLGEVYFEAPTAVELGQLYFAPLPDPLPITNESSRDIWAFATGAKFTFWEDFDVVGGMRLENLFIESINEPFTGAVEGGIPTIFPARTLMWERRDNPTRPRETPTAPAFTVFNDEILGAPVPIDDTTTVCHKFDLITGQTDTRGCVDLDAESQEELLNGEINERKYLPAVALAWRPMAGLTLRGSWSQTVARPSFREMGYYISFEPGSDEPVIGNPQLQLSEVESIDGRVEYLFGETDLVAFSLFKKYIQNPIEQILIKDPGDFTDQGQYRTFFNNPNEANLFGLEVEFRKSLDFIPSGGFMDYFTVGGNYTYIDAKVDRTDVELQRTDAWFVSCSPDDVPNGRFCTRSGEGAKFTELSPSRRLFGQPEWIANADITFDQPDWGTRITLAFFAISDVLETAGGATFIDPGGFVRRLSLDRYIDSFYTLDLIVSQSWSPEFLRGELGFKFQVKNLTDSVRGRSYDPEATSETAYERRFRVGRNYKFAISYTF
jgi:hypothetical protein